jgi:hypothetical protein
LLCYQAGWQRCHVTLPATKMVAGPTGRTEPSNGGRGLPALAQAARATCRWPGVPPLIGGLF